MTSRLSRLLAAARDGSYPGPPSPVRRARWVAVLDWAAVLVLAAVLAFTDHDSKGLDLKVYREGARAVVRGADLYAPILGPVGDPGLPFTYPPFAALLFTPLTVVPLLVSYVAIVIASVVALHLVSLDVAARLASVTGMRNIPPAIITIGALATVPFRWTIGLGQINVLLMAACYLVIARGGSWRWFAVAVGVTAGIKLTPILLLLAPLVRGRLREVGWGVGAFAATQVLTLLALPSLTVRYWGGVIHDPSRIGDVWYIDNVSLRGTTERLQLPPALWLALSLCCLVLVGVAVWRARRSLDDAALVAATSALALLVSPVSWVHHFIWFPVIVGAWITAGRAVRGPRYILLAAAALLVAALSVSVKNLFGLRDIPSVDAVPLLATVAAALPCCGLLVGTAALLFAGDSERGGGGSSTLDGSRPTVGGRS